MQRSYFDWIQNDSTFSSKSKLEEKIYLFDDLVAKVLLAMGDRIWRAGVKSGIEIFF
jgi:hypothetical protein